MTRRITLQPAGNVFEVGQGEAILAAAMRQGVAMAYSCRDGTCGSCKSRLVEGQKVSFDIEADRRSGKSAAANLQTV